MARTFVYSFEDTTVTINIPSFGTYSAWGTGIGNISVAFSNDISSHEVAADLSVVVSKFAARNGSISFEVLQGSDFSDWLKRAVTYLMSPEVVSSFADTTITITNRTTNEKYFASGVTPQKRADDAYQSTAQNRTWTFLCADISVQ